MPRSEDLSRLLTGSTSDYPVTLGPVVFTSASSRFLTIPDFLLKAPWWGNLKRAGRVHNVSRWSAYGSCLHLGWDS